MSGTEEVQGLVDQASEMPYGEAKSVLLEEALRRAEALRDRDLAFVVRMELTGAYQYGAEPAKSFATFSRCLAEYDAEPGRFDEWQSYNLHWQFKWIISDMMRFPEVPLRRAHDALAEMERRYQEAGHGLHAVHAKRCHLAHHVGDRAQAEEWFRRWQTTPRGQMSDCEGCDPSGKVWHLVLMGRDEEAVELAAPVVAGELTCHVQPQGILTKLLLPYVRTGRLEEAAAAHRRAYRIVQGDTNYVDDFGDHIEFCALTGNEARGLEILEREASLLERAASPRAAMWFAAAAGLLLRRLAETGHGDTTVRWVGGEIPVGVLREQLASRARGLAARFDARNGTPEQGTRVEQTLSAEPLVEYLPLTPHARRFAVPVRAVPDVVRSEDPETLLDQASESWARADHEAALALWARFDELHASREPTRSQAARRADGSGLAAALREDDAAAAREWALAADLHAEAGDQPRRQVALGRLGLSRCRAGAVEEGIGLLEESAAYLLAHAAAEYGGAATSRLAQAYLMAGRTSEALGLLEPAGDDDGRLLTLLAEALQEIPGRQADAATAAGRARDALREQGGLLLARACMLHARLLCETGDDLDGAVSAYSEALVSAPRSAADLRAVAHASRGELLVAFGRSAEAADDLIEAVAAFTALGATGFAALARVDLCRAYLSTRRPMDAAEAAEEALAMLADDDHDNRLTVTWARGQALDELGELDAALADYTTVAERLRAAGRALDSAHVLEAAAHVLVRLGRHAEAVEGFAAAAARHPEVLARARALRRRANAMFHLDDEEPAAVLALDEARTALAGASATDPEVIWEKSRIAYEQGKILDWLDRLEEAAARCAEAAAGFREIGDEEAAALAERLGGSDDG
ncbi:hypothetical protein [Streptosporangium sp. KLBMP 9127]|nr:hypothetical protein [Streptosporangium sp. KLBMP 9127]